MLRLRYRLIPLLCFLILPAGQLLAQDASTTREDQIALAAPTVTGETGLFHVITADTLHHGDWSCWPIGDDQAADGWRGGRGLR